MCILKLSVQLFIWSPFCYRLLQLRGSSKYYRLDCRSIEPLLYNSSKYQFAIFWNNVPIFSFIRMGHQNIMAAEFNPSFDFSTLLKCKIIYLQNIEHLLFCIWGSKYFSCILTPSPFCFQLQLKWVKNITDLNIKLNPLFMFWFWRGSSILYGCIILSPSSPFLTFRSPKSFRGHFAFGLRPSLCVNNFTV